MVSKKMSTPAISSAFRNKIKGYLKKCHFEKEGGKNGV